MDRVCRFVGTSHPRHKFLDLWKDEAILCQLVGIGKIAKICGVHAGVPSSGALFILRGGYK